LVQKQLKRGMGSGIYFLTSLLSILSEQVPLEKDQRNSNIVEKVYEWGDSQRMVAEHLGMHYSTISRLIKKWRL
jgi:DNA-directed RNA polymerase specialized sigma subunit